MLTEAIIIIANPNVLCNPWAKLLDGAMIDRIQKSKFVRPELALPSCAVIYDIYTSAGDAKLLEKLLPAWWNGFKAYCRRVIGGDAFSACFQSMLDVWSMYIKR